MYHKVKDGIFFNEKLGRIVEHKGRSTRIHWSKDMLDFLRSNFAITLNDELAGCLGVSLRTMLRKARELGLQKDRRWLSGIWDERRHMAQCVVRRNGNSGQFKKGMRAYPDGEFKAGRVMSQEEKDFRSKIMKRWYLQNPAKAREKALKAWETRKKREYDRRRENQEA